MIGFFKKIFSSKPLPIAEQYDERGFNVYGDHINGTKYDDNGFDVRGFGENGKMRNRKYYDDNGFDAKGIHLTGKKYIGGYDCFGYDSLGFSKEGWNREGIDREGYNRGASTKTATTETEEHKRAITSRAMMEKVTTKRVTIAMDLVLVVIIKMATITKLDTAIETVSSMRSNFGAIQNRREHAYESTMNTAENLTAAESRIRDTDMAK